MVIRRRTGIENEASSILSMIIALVIFPILIVASVSFFAPTAAGLGGIQVQSQLIVIEDNGQTEFANRWSVSGPTVKANRLTPLFDGVNAQNITLGQNHAAVRTNYDSDALLGGTETDMWAFIAMDRSTVVDADITSIKVHVNSTDMTLNAATLSIFFKTCDEADLIANCLIASGPSYIIDEIAVTALPFEADFTWDGSDDLGINALDMTVFKFGFVVFRFADEVIVEGADIFIDAEILANVDPIIDSNTATAIAFFLLGFMAILLGLLVREDFSVKSLGMIVGL